MATDTFASPATLRYNPSKVFKNFIDGEWVESSTGETFENRNPADTRDVVGVFQKSGKDDVNAAVDAAKRAFAKWRLVPAPRRAEIVFRAAEFPIGNKEDFAREMTREMGKVLKETRGDVQEAIDAAYYNAGEGRRMFGPTVPSELPNKFAMAVRQPIGICGMITPWNFPMAISSWKLLPAIVCGNTCVIKPAQDTPLSTFNLVQALTEAGLPKGVINVVAGFGPEVGTPLAEHADVVILTNLTDRHRDMRAEQLAGHGIHARVFTNQGPKGPALKAIMDEYAPSRAVFIDDLAQHHASVGGEVPHIRRLHLCGEPMLADRIVCAHQAGDAHARIDTWEHALPWLLDQITREKESA